MLFWRQGQNVRSKAERNEPKVHFRSVNERLLMEFLSEGFFLSDRDYEI